MTVNHNISAFKDIVKTYNNSKIQQLTWAEIRHRVADLNPELSGIIDDIDPGSKYRLYLIKYKYGDEIVKNGVFHVPYSNKLLPIYDKSIPKIIRNDLSYNRHSNPACFLLNNTVELFINFRQHTIPSFGIIGPGNVFSTSIVLNKQRSLHPAFVWNMTSGARSIFMLPKISNVKKHKNLQKNFLLKGSAPRGPSEHWLIFKEIVNSSNSNEKWETEALYFSKEWTDSLQDPAWQKLEHYLLKQLFQGTEHWRNQSIWDLAFSLLQNEQQIKVEPYISETVKHILFMRLGVLPGFGVATNNIAGPVDFIKETYSNIYGLQSYSPIVMVPHRLLLENKHDSVFYSLNYPNSLEFSPRTSNRRSSISDLYAVSNLLNRYIDTLLLNKMNIRGTMFDLALNKNNYSFYHDQNSGHSNIKNTESLASEKPFFASFLEEGKKLSLFSSFLRGCIRVSCGS